MPDGAFISPEQLIRLRIRVRGAVQGVGFRPFVWALAGDLGLSGFVFNDEEGVLIEVEGAVADTDAFARRLEEDAPPLARIDRVEAAQTRALGGEKFDIRKSARGGAARTMVTPDIATCPDCLAEMFDPADRRYLYPFTNCTNCGPRHTITRALPYDRAETSMAAFAMCGSCAAEYEDPADRRFHAQPNACPDCGPRLSMEIPEIVARLTAGEIVAIKGLGGFHLACDARNEASVARLRRQKAREGKPFAVMVAGLASAKSLADVSAMEADMLTDQRRPIVVCAAKRSNGLAPGVSNDLPSVGLFLPYTPLHYLLFHEAAGRPKGTGWLEAPRDLALVMTSANPGGEPLVRDNDEAHARLGSIADVIVDYDRDIVTRCDDSVMRQIAGAPSYLRRARGATPEPIRLARALPPTLALGGHLKNTVCVIRGEEAYLSQHIGDLDNAATLKFFDETAAHLLSILEVTPEVVACDLHPDFLSTRRAEDFGAPVVRVQHHHAHIAAVAAEHHLDGPLIGLALDGFGLGADGASSWGGELLRVDGARFERLGGLHPLAQPGGDKAARAPWRMGAAALHALDRAGDIERRFAGEAGAATIAAMLERGVNAPMTSSAGRLFDAACGLLGVVPHASYEGEAPMALEALADDPIVLPNGWRIENGALDFRPLLAALCDADRRAGANIFHGTLAAGLAEWAARAVAAHETSRRVALSGGCLQNRVLAERLVTELAARGVQAILPRLAPANDGGLSLGQAFVAALSLERKETGGADVPCAAG
ncbi:MAG: carbamoyltransferase HypF [Pseudomonadota bacterium]